ncbi:DEAD/DEAH box helicase [Apilactobacillus bombintestini]|uniref:DEAD/DEAH box helicase n=1 Tax=Apilactobacillus bombintestini TaxID=2419772 RepID=A0A387AQ53_9LACO|nr:helicase-related protein [Apilactobacillus bombintestini]AYF92874.1 DEAD/DEAH box helicase [Apilactobacillus bombintestini]
MIENISELYGRHIDEKLVSDSLVQRSTVQKYTPIKIEHNHIYCKRCGQITKYIDAKMPNDNYYCPICINLGRITLNSPLCYVKEPNDFNIKNPVLTWHGKLTKEQDACSKDIIKVFNSSEKHLLWAVTGAGKTEMLFFGIEDALKQQKRICIASPRVDVCVELYPRIKEAFANTSMILLHGRSEVKYQYCQLTICTTHQLLRFYKAFDVLIIDEVDSFPFVDNAALYFAANNAVKEQGATLYLTATPSEELMKQIKRKKIGVSYLPIRFHRHLLPQIKNRHVKEWRGQLTKNKLPASLIRNIKDKINKQQRFLLFVPRVADLKPVSEILSKTFDNSLWRTVHSSDEKRMEKVSQMRNEELLFLITTTILERGVTFPGIDVLILGADDDVFSASSLVQIAGRVGRKKDRPYGDVSFYSSVHTNNIKKAIKQIKYMNRLAKKLK